MLTAVRRFPVNFGYSDSTARVAEAASHNVVDGTPVNVSVETG